MNLMNEGVLPPNELDDRDERREELEAQDIETTADLIAWLRRPREGENAYLTAWRDEIADRLEAAHKRERGNAAKLREAVGYILKYADSVACRDHDEHTRHYIDQIRKWAQSALDAPTRNCDVGTAKEQDERFHRFCVKHHTGSCAGCHNPVGDYTVANGVRECALVWAQMPYEEGGAK